jgi:hypothetical protein
MQDRNSVKRKSISAFQEYQQEASSEMLYFSRPTSELNKSCIWITNDHLYAWPLVMTIHLPNCNKILLVWISLDYPPRRQTHWTFLKPATCSNRQKRKDIGDVHSASATAAATLAIFHCKCYAVFSHTLSAHKDSHNLQLMDLHAKNIWGSASAATWLDLSKH